MNQFIRSMGLRLCPTLRDKSGRASWQLLALLGSLFREPVADPVEAPGFFGVPST